VQPALNVQTAQLIQPTSNADLFQMIQKTISPPLLPAVSPPIQFLPAVNFLPPVSIADFGVAPTVVPQLSSLPQISYKELEQLLMLRHQLNYH
jgi:hypothetical protein